jgi:hypothetical protein
MSQANVAMDRDWIANEFSKGIDAERSLAADAQARGDAPPEPALGVLYHEIAEADERHAAIVEKIATRYGHTPSRVVAGGVGRVWSRLKEKITELGLKRLDQLSGELTAKAESIQWYTAWVHTFDTLGDTESARELATVLAEEQAHHKALQEVLNRWVEEGARQGELTSTPQACTATATE